MKTYIKQMPVLFLALAASLFLLDAHAGKPVKVTVTAADPPSALQGEMIEVDIDGTGFDAGSTARFIVTDTRDDTQIDVNEVTFDAATGKLKAKIKVKDAALPVEYDIEVMTSSGRRGKGTTLFQVREKAGADDPCLTSTSPFPAFMFWRDTGTQNSPSRAIYLASEDGVCIRVLAEFPVSSGALGGWDSAFSYDKAINRGRVVWLRDSTDIYWEEVWLLEFDVVGNTIKPPPDPEIILTNPDPETFHYIDVDISADMQKLAYIFRVAPPDEMITWETHVLEIDACTNPNSPCVPNSSTKVLSDTQPYAPYLFWSRLIWGPLGERIYLTQQPGVLEQWAIRMVTMVDGIWTDEQELLTSDEYPEYAGLRNMTSGISDDGEKLAFRHWGDCLAISMIDVAACEAGPTEFNLRPCEAEAQFFGTNPSWTDRGTIIHEIVERVKKHPRKEIYNCISSDFIGEWNPVNSEVTTLAEGKYPDTR